MNCSYSSIDSSLFAWWRKTSLCSSIASYEKCVSRRLVVSVVGFASETRTVLAFILGWVLDPLSRRTRLALDWSDVDLIGTWKEADRWILNTQGSPYEASICEAVEPVAPMFLRQFRLRSFRPGPGLHGYGGRSPADT